MTEENITLNMSCGCVWKAGKRLRLCDYHVEVQKKVFDEKVIK